MNLHEEALLVYDELEVLFFQVLRDKSLSWFGTLASPARNDDSAPLLSVTRKPYRDLILANSISVLDFRVYLLASQCAIFSSMGRVVEVGRKAVTFLQTFVWRLREIKVGNITTPSRYMHLIDFTGSTSTAFCRVLDLLVSPKRS